jgi:spermidine synthase
MPNNNRLIIWSIIATGISSITVQLITVREFLAQFQGNEITISLVLFCWLLLTGIGSLIARFYKRPSPVLYSLIILLIALWPLPQTILIRQFRDVIFIHGVSPGFYQIFFYIASMTSVYCLLIGFVLPYALEVLKDNNHYFTSGELYITDNIGDIMGGVLFSFILVYFLKPFKIIAVTSGLLIFISILLLLSLRRYYLLILSVVLTCLFYMFALNSYFEESVLAGQYGRIVKYLESPFGRIVITKEGTQHTFWESGLPLYSDANITESEEKIHYPMSQIEKAGDVLLISGGLGETMDEILKYNPERIYYVELDPYLTGTAQEMGFLRKNASLRVINMDARSFMKKSDKRYDAIIIDLPDPDTFQLNRFFTSEFFALAKHLLNSEGIFSFGISYSQNYVSGLTKKKISTLYNTALSHFKNVLILPGEEAYFLCSDGEISADVPERLRAKSISTRYIEGFYYGNVTSERIKGLHEIIDSEEYINTDFEPRMMNIIFKEWFLKHGDSPKAFLLVFLIIILIYLTSMKREEYILFSSGIAAMGVEMLVIFAFQVIHGYIYLKIGAIVTVFLLGLLPGATVGNLYKEKSIAGLVISDIILICLLLFFFAWISFFKTELNQYYFLSYCFVFSFFCGFQFPVATRIIGEKMSPAAGCIAADLAGAAVGTLVVGTLLIPLWGVWSAIVFLLLIKISSSMIILSSRRTVY